MSYEATAETPPKYNYHIPVQYSTNTEYRECFRRVFSIDTAKVLAKLEAIYADFDTFEDETKDELIFDEVQVNAILCYIMDLTSEYEPFRELYKKAAALMISQDLDIGLSILLSYDYFQDFHAVLTGWLSLVEGGGGGGGDKINADVFVENSEAFQKLRIRLWKK